MPAVDPPPPKRAPNAELTERVKRLAKEAGFELCGIAPAARPETLDHFSDWLSQGFQGEMGYLERRREAYAHPAGVLHSVRSLVLVGASYEKPASLESGPGRIAAYAQSGADYHNVLRDKLRALSDELHAARPGCRTRIVVDTAPLLERDAALRAGLGWFGKNTMLINKRIGSYFFLSALLTDVELVPDPPHVLAHCGTCTRCLDACPTNAFAKPYVLDARRCLSYLTIELRDRPIPEEMRADVQVWLFGCDICQEVCPWNRKAPAPQMPEFSSDLGTISPETFLQIDVEEFATRFGQTPLSRPGPDGMARNAAIVLGNSRDSRWVPQLVTALRHESSLVRHAVAWALGRMGTVAARAALADRMSCESDDVVTQEIKHAIDSIDKNRQGKRRS